MTSSFPSPVVQKMAVRTRALNKAKWQYWYSLFCANHSSFCFFKLTTVCVCVCVDHSCKKTILHQMTHRRFYRSMQLSNYSKNMIIIFTLTPLLWPLTSVSLIWSWLSHSGRRTDSLICFKVCLQCASHISTVINRWFCSDHKSEEDSRQIIEMLRPTCWMFASQRGGVSASDTGGL